MLTFAALFPLFFILWVYSMLYCKCAKAYVPSPDCLSQQWKRRSIFQLLLKDGVLFNIQSYDTVKLWKNYLCRRQRKVKFVLDENANTMKGIVQTSSSLIIHPISIFHCMTGRILALNLHQNTSNGVFFTCRTWFHFIYVPFQNKKCTYEIIRKRSNICSDGAKGKERYWNFLTTNGG
jgi:hypothetical protein